MKLPSSGERLNVVGSTDTGSRSLGLQVNLMMADQKSQGNKLIPPVNQAMAVSSNFLPFPALQFTSRICTEQHGPSVSLDPALVSPWPGRMTGTAVCTARAPHIAGTGQTPPSRMCLCPCMSECAHTGLLQRQGAPGHAVGVWVCAFRTPDWLLSEEPQPVSDCHGR